MFLVHSVFVQFSIFRSWNFICLWYSHTLMTHNHFCCKIVLHCRLLTNRGPDRSGSCLISIWQLPDQSCTCLILPWWLPDHSGGCLILIRQWPDRSGSCLILISHQPDRSGRGLILIRQLPDRSGSRPIFIFSDFLQSNL